MKKTSLLTLFLFLFGTVITTAFGSNPPADMVNLKGQSNTWLGDYQIVELAPVTDNGHRMRAFELTYTNAPKTVMIYLDESFDCREYIVRSKNLEVKYVCNKAGFGAKLLSGKFRKYDPQVNENFLSRDEFKKQSKIAEGGLEADIALGLIASYYPGLLKNNNLLD